MPTAGHITSVLFRYRGPTDSSYTCAPSRIGDHAT